MKLFKQLKTRLKNSKFIRHSRKRLLPSSDGNVADVDENSTDQDLEIAPVPSCKKVVPKG